MHGQLFSLVLTNKTSGEQPWGLPNDSTEVHIDNLRRRQTFTLKAQETDLDGIDLYETEVDTTVVVRGIDLLAGNLAAPPAAGLFQRPAGLAVNAAGEVFVADRDNHAIRQISPNGNTVTFAGSLGRPGDADGTVANARFNHPTDIAFDPAGRMFVLEPDQDQVKLIKTDNTVTIFRGLLDSPKFLAAFPDPAAAAFVTSTVSLHDPNLRDVEIYYNVGNAVTVVAEVVPEALAVDPTGDVLVLTREPGAQKHVLRRYHNPGAGAWAVAGETAFGPDAQAGQDFPMPDIRAMAVDGQGSIFLTDAANGMIWCISQDLGNIIPIAGRTPPAGLAPWDFPADLYQPSALAVTPQGDLIVTSGNAVLQITAPMTLGGVVPPPAADIPPPPPLDIPEPPPAGSQGPGGGAAMALGIRNFRPVPALALPGEDVELRWDLVGQPTQVTLTDNLTGRATPIMPPNLTTWRVGAIQRRQSFTLKVEGQDAAGMLEASAEVTVGAKGIDRLAGDAEHVRKAYCDGPVAGGAAWRHVTGLLWHHGDLFFAEGPDHTIRKLEGADARVVAFAGLRGSPQEALKQHGMPLRLNQPGPMAFLAPYLYVVDTGSHTIKRIEIKADGTGVLEPFAGSPGVAGNADGVGRAATFHSPADIVASQDFLFVADRGNNRIRMIAPDGTVQTIPHGVPGPEGLALDAHGKLFITSPGRSMIEVLEPQAAPGGRTQWHLRPVSGAAGPGFQDGPLAQARFDRPMGLAFISQDELLVADSGNNLVRRVNLATGQVETCAGDPAVRAAGWNDDVLGAARFHAPSRLAVSNIGEIYLADQEGRALRMIGANGRVATLGPGIAPSAAGSDDGPSQGARFRKPLGVVVDRKGWVYVADSANHAIRRIIPRGDVDTVYGDPNLAGGYDGRGQAALFGDPSELAMDSSGNLFVLEPAARRMREIDPDGNAETVIAGPGTPSHIAACPMAREQALVMAVRQPRRADKDVVLIRPGGQREVVAACKGLAALAMDPAGNVFVLEMERVKQLARLTKYHKSEAGDWTAAGAIAIGPGGRTGTASGVPDIHGMAADSHGYLFLADTANGLVWKVSPDLQQIGVVAGSYPFLTSTRGGKPLDAPLYQPHRIAVTPMNDLIVTAGHAVLQITAPGTQDAPWTAPGDVVVRRPGRGSVPTQLPGAEDLARKKSALKTNHKPKEAPEDAPAESQQKLKKMKPASRRPPRPSKPKTREEILAEERRKALGEGDDDSASAPQDQDMEDGQAKADREVQEAVARRIKEEAAAAADAKRAEAEKFRMMEAARLARRAGRTPEQTAEEEAAQKAREAAGRNGGNVMEEIRRAKAERERRKAEIQAAEARRQAALEARKHAAAQAATGSGNARNAKNSERERKIKERLKAQEERKRSDDDDAWD